MLSLWHCPAAAHMQAVRAAVLELIVELIVTSSTFVGNCLQVCRGWNAGMFPAVWPHQVFFSCKQLAPCMGLSATLETTIWQLAVVR